MLQLLWHFGEFVLRQDLFRQPLRAATFPKGEGMALPRQCVKLQFETAIVQKTAPSGWTVRFCILYCGQPFSWASTTSWRSSYSTEATNTATMVPFSSRMVVMG